MKKMPTSIPSLSLLRHNTEGGKIQWFSLGLEQLANL